MASDPLAEVLDLEDKFYKDGYQRGFQDGLQAGKIEGRHLGLEQGFEKFSASARLCGRAIIWANRLPQVRRLRLAAKSGASAIKQDAEIGDDGPAAQPRLPDVPDNPRLVKHVTTLYAWVESESLSTENTDEAVNDFDDRIKRAQGKFKIIERIVDEVPAKTRTSGPRTSQAEGLTRRPELKPKD